MVLVDVGGGLVVGVVKERLTAEREGHDLQRVLHRVVVRVGVHGRMIGPAAWPVNA